MNVTIVSAKLLHCSDLAPKLRPLDVSEVLASAGVGPLEALVSSFRASDPDMCWTALIEGRPEVMWGVAPYGDVGGAWLLGSNAILQIKKKFWLECLHYTAKMHERYPVLTNWVSINNVPSLSWLEALGFSPVDFDPTYGVGKQPFLRYESCVNR